MAVSYRRDSSHPWFCCHLWFGSGRGMGGCRISCNFKVTNHAMPTYRVSRPLVRFGLSDRYSPSVCRERSDVAGCVVGKDFTLQLDCSVKFSLVLCANSRFAQIAAGTESALQSVKRVLPIQVECSCTAPFSLRPGVPFRVQSRRAGAEILSPPSPEIQGLRS